MPRPGDAPVDMLRMGGEETLGWKGQWPPPERLAKAVGHQTGLTSWFDPDDPSSLPPGITINEIGACSDITIYRRGTYSQIPDTDDCPNLARGAEYVMEGQMCEAIGCSNLATHTWSGHWECDECMAPMFRTPNPPLH